MCFPCRGLPPPHPVQQQYESFIILVGPSPSSSSSSSCDPIQLWLVTWCHPTQLLRWKQEHGLIISRLTSYFSGVFPSRLIHKNLSIFFFLFELWHCCTDDDATWGLALFCLPYHATVAVLSCITFYHGINNIKIWMSTHKYRGQK